MEQSDFVPFDPIVKRTEATLRDKKTGKTFKTSKGAPHVLLKLTTDKKVHHQCEADVTALGSRGIRALAVAIEEDGVWHMVHYQYIHTFLNCLKFFFPIMNAI